MVGCGVKFSKDKLRRLFFSRIERQDIMEAHWPNKCSPRTKVLGKWAPTSLASTLILRLAIVSYVYCKFSRNLGNVMVWWSWSRSGSSFIKGFLTLAFTCCPFDLQQAAPGGESACASVPRNAQPEERPASHFLVPVEACADCRDTCLSCSHRALPGIESHAPQLSFCLTCTSYVPVFSLIFGFHF